MARREGKPVAYARATLLFEVFMVTELGRLEDAAEPLAELILALLAPRDPDPLAPPGKTSRELRSFAVLPAFDDIPLTVAIEGRRVTTRQDAVHRHHASPRPVLLAAEPGSPRHATAHPLTERPALCGLSHGLSAEEVGVGLSGDRPVRAIRSTGVVGLTPAPRGLVPIPIVPVDRAREATDHMAQQGVLTVEHPERLSAPSAAPSLGSQRCWKPWSYNAGLTLGPVVGPSRLLPSCGTGPDATVGKPPARRASPDRYTTFRPSQTEGSVLDSSGTRTRMPWLREPLNLRA